MMTCLAFVIFTALVGVDATLQAPLTTAPTNWISLNRTIGGKLLQGAPLAQPCTEEPSDIFSPERIGCYQVQVRYSDEVYRAEAPGSFINAQWETCQTTGEQCLLDFRNTTDLRPILPPRKCSLGSIPSHFIDVRSEDDVRAALDFSKSTKVPLVVKNTGHDYKGRSSAPRSLGLWMHNMKDMTYHPAFIPEGCPPDAEHTRSAVTVGAGVQWKDLYAFAESNNVTVVGGSDKSVGVSGGWLMGGGHSLLSNTLGLGVDRVLQFKIVTPDGKLRIANACQNPDLFFALRGGGGGTFGIVLESTQVVSPRVTLQVVIVGWAKLNMSLTEEMWSIMVENGLKWADEGWGAVARSEIAVHLTPQLDKDRAAESMSPLIEFGKRLKNDGVEGAILVVAEFPSWGTFFESFASKYVASVGISLALASRLISKDNFRTLSGRSSLVSAMLESKRATPGMLIMMTTPASFPGDGQTSVTEAWRSSLYHITVFSPWNWDAKSHQKRKHYEIASGAIDHLRRITPDAAYSNEADVYEPNHEASFWGSHYEDLLKIKHKYDPDHLLDCWQCVGWEAESPQFSCYL